jgi:hypothetical protein
MLEFLALGSRRRVAHFSLFSFPEGYSLVVQMSNDAELSRRRDFGAGRVPFVIVSVETTGLVLVEPCL